MEFNIHQQILFAAFAVGAVTGAVANKTAFCTMGAVSDWVNMGDSGRMRSWVFAMGIALVGVVALEASGVARLGTDTFPPYRTPAFAWLRYVLGGLLFGIGMTLASGCGNKTLVRIGGGNLKSLVVLLAAAITTYFMLWTPVFEKAFLPWIQATTVDLAQYGIGSQEVGALIAGVLGIEATRVFVMVTGVLVATGMLCFALKSGAFRSSFDNVLGGATMGLAVVVGWCLTAGPPAQKWKDYTEFLTEIPSRVQAQSLTFVAPMGDAVHYLLAPGRFSLLNFGIMVLTGVIAGSLAYALASRSFRIEKFASLADFGRHAAGGMLMGVGGVLAMGCTIGQGITGMSTLAAGSLITFAAIVAGATATMKYEYWRIMQEA